MGLAFPVVHDGRVYTAMDDIALTQVLLIAGRALDDIDNKPLAVALRVGVKPTWLIARFTRGPPLAYRHRERREPCG